MLSTHNDTEVCVLHSSRVLDGDPSGPTNQLSSTQTEQVVGIHLLQQQQDHPNLLQGMFNRKVWGEVLESVLKLCLRHRTTRDVTTSEQHQL